MAKSRYEYVKLFEKDDRLLPNTWIVVRLDGRGFHGFSKAHGFEKPNDLNALNLMNTAAKAVMRELSSDIVLGYGDSDEYSFLLTRECKLYNRREFKIVTAFVSLFTSFYMFHWKEFFPQKELKYPPSFDGRAILYPDVKNVRDYFAWRQADCHINNLYNTTFWALVGGGLSEAEASKRLDGTESADKNEILWAEFGKNYNKEPPIFRKGTVLYRETEVIIKEAPPVSDQSNGELEETEAGATKSVADEDEQLPPNAGTETPSDGSEITTNEAQLPPSSPGTLKSKVKKGRAKRKQKRYVIKEDHCDIIKDAFWLAKPWILG